MGCVSSRIVTRSASYHEDLTGGTHRRSGSVGLPVDFLLPNKSNQFLALICPADAFPEKVTSCPPPLPLEFCEDVPEEISASESQPEVINAWELMADLDDEESVASSAASAGRMDSASKTSTSFQAVEDDGDTVSDCRSLDGDRAGSPRGKLSNPDDFPPSDAFMDCEESEPSGNIQAGRLAPAAADKMQNPEASSVQSEEPGPSGSFYNTTQPSGSFSNEDQAEQGDGHKELVATGNISRRRARAEELTPLRISSLVDFPALGSLRDWLQSGGQLFSPGSSVTPRFGEHGRPVSRSRGRDTHDSGGLDPELLEAFEEALAELNTEEQGIARQI